MGLSFEERVRSCLSSLMEWARGTFGNLKKQIKDGERVIESLQSGAIDATKLAMCREAVDLLNKLP